MKVFINFIVIGFFIVTLASARTSIQVDIYKEHGEALSKAPYHIRYQFEKQTGIYWKNSSYAQRKGFLENYYSDVAEQEKNSKEKNKIEQADIKQRKSVDKDKARELREKDRDRERKLREEEKLKNEEDKAFKKEIRRREKEIQELRKEQAKRMHDHG